MVSQTNLSSNVSQPAGCPVRSGLPVAIARLPPATDVIVLAFALDHRNIMAGGLLAYVSREGEDEPGIDQNPGGRSPDTLKWRSNASPARPSVPSSKSRPMRVTP